MTNRQDPNLAATALAMRGRGPASQLAVVALAHLTIMVSTSSQAKGWHAMLASTIAEAELSLDQLATIVRQHSGTDETMDSARASARARLVRQVTHWRATSRTE